MSLSQEQGRQCSLKTSEVFSGLVSMGITSKQTTGLSRESLISYIDFCNVMEIFIIIFFIYTVHADYYILSNKEGVRLVAVCFTNSIETG